MGAVGQILEKYENAVKQLRKINDFCAVCNSGFAEGIYAHIDRLSLDQGADLCLGVEDPVAVVELIRRKAQRTL